MAKRFALEGDDNLDFSSINQMMAKGSAYAGKLEPAEEKKEDKPEEKEAQKEETEPVAETGAAGEAQKETTAQPTAEIKADAQKTDLEPAKEAKPKDKKQTKKTAQKKDAAEAKKQETATAQAEQMTEEQTLSGEDLPFPTFSEIMYNMVGNREDNEFLTIRIAPDLIAKLDVLTKNLPKGKKSSRGQVVANLLTYFYKKYAKEVEAFETLSKVK